MYLHHESKSIQLFPDHDMRHGAVTSMAAPIVTGIAALIREYYSETHSGGSERYYYEIGC